MDGNHLLILALGSLIFALVKARSMMSNHVHLLVTPHDADGLALALRHAHGRYAIYWNAVHRSSGHAWQGRYYSCPLDRVHLWEALRYTELNPVRAGLASEAQAWRWSSATAHCGVEVGNELLDLEVWRNNWTASAWRHYLAAGEMESKLAEIPRCTPTGRPLGSTEFVQALERAMKRRLAPQKGGRPPKTGWMRDRANWPLNQSRWRSII
ncbi:MAG TPA: transposase [Acidobacteriaceae bacterium]|nr:transposase [Acidobacteriaceae bacterium]